jgi:hypothetical protein
VAADHEHEYGIKRKGTRHCRVKGCRALMHEHEPVHDERRGWACKHCSAWLSSPVLEGSGEEPRLPPRKLKPRKPRTGQAGAKPGGHLEVVR